MAEYVCEILSACMKVFRMETSSAVRDSSISTLLAALQWSQGSKEYSQTVAQLCNEPNWCQRYSTVDVVMGRWTPRAVEAWRGLLQEKAVQRELKDGFARAR